MTCAPTPRGCKRRWLRRARERPLSAWGVPGRARTGCAHNSGGDEGLCTGTQRVPGCSSRVQPAGGALLGLAVDAGTTKLAGYLVDLASGETLARVGAMNPQTAYGEDVVTRITYANTADGAAQLLHERLVDELNRMVGELCQQAGADRGQIVDAVVVGNTAMHHFVTGLPVRQLGEAPYVACVSDSMVVRAEEIGVHLDGGATLYLPPNIAGYVGSDHVAMLLASGLADTTLTVLALDIGTNTEISLSHKGAIWSCSTASGPAFEGAHIHDGMRAAPGAVEHVRFHGGAFQVQTIAKAPPIGICGSGILDVVAQGLKAGIIDQRGSLVKGHPLVSSTESGPTCLLVPAGRAGHGRDVVFTRSDVNEIQLAKGAIRAGSGDLVERGRHRGHRAWTASLWRVLLAPTWISRAR